MRLQFYFLAPQSFFLQDRLGGKKVVDKAHSRLGYQKDRKLCQDASVVIDQANSA